MFLRYSQQTKHLCCFFRGLIKTTMSRQEEDSEMHLLTEAAAQVTEMKIRVGLNSYLLAFSIESYLIKHNNLTNRI